MPPESTISMPCESESNAAASDELKVPFDVIDSYPENEFSVTLHVQRAMALDTSRRLGRALHEIVSGEPIKTEPPPANATLTIRRATRVDGCGHAEDLTPAFGGACNGKASCDIDLSRWRQPSDNSCVASYTAEFGCTGGPVRIIRQESETRFGGRFQLDCKRHARWARDAIPRGIEVADASFGGKGGNPTGLVTLRTMAFCNGLLSCDYAIRAPDGSPQTGNFAARWYCGAEQKTLELAAAKAGEIAHLACP
jgi:hypothetical protein